MHFNRKILITLIALPLPLIFSVITHEYGHLLTAKMLGIDSFHVYIWPGIELSPNFGRSFPTDWPEGAIAFTNNYPVSKNALFNAGIYDQLSVPSSFSVSSSLGIKSPIAKHVVTNENQYAIVALMGSVTNLVISFLCISIIYILRPKGMFLIVTVCGALLNYDLLFYSVFPVVFDLPHLIFWGGKTAEPINALTTLGINQYLSLVTIITLSFIQWRFLSRILFLLFVSIKGDIKGNISGI